MNEELTQEENDRLDRQGDQDAAADAAVAEAQHREEVNDAAQEAGEQGKEVAETAPEKGSGIAALTATDGQIVAIIPRSIEESYRLAQAMQKAGMVPRGMESRTGDAKEEASKMMIAILKGLEVGFPPISALSTIMVVNNRPSIWGDGAAALIHRSGKCEYVKEWVENENFDEQTGQPVVKWTAYCEVKRKDQTEPLVRSFSIEDAKRAKLVGNPKKQIWMQYPQRMLPARARAWAFRDAFADVLMGFGIYEEDRDLVEEVVVKVDESVLDDEAVA
jgi:hypothetical protein